MDSVKPDIVIGTETFLTKDIPTPTELDAAYDVERRDRLTRDGGVLIAAKKDLLMTREYDLETDCEVMWCKLNMAGSKTLHIGSFYRPDISDDSSLGQLAISLSRIPPGHSVLLGGDFNLPHVDWENDMTKAGGKFPEHHDELIKIFHN